MATGIWGSLLLEVVTRANTGGLSKTDNAIRKVGRSLGNTSKKASILSKLTNNLFGGINIHSISNAFNGYLQFEKNLGAIQSRFYAVEGSVEGANRQFEFARKIARDTATSIQDVVDSYSIFYASARKSPLGEQGAQYVYKSWSEVSRVLHLSGTQYERVMYALREMSSKGQLYAQDLQIQMGTHVPAIRDIANTAIQNLGIKGVSSIKDFQEYTKNPKNKDAMARFLVEMTRETKKRYATDDALKKALEQPDALATQIQNLGYEFAYQFSKSGGNYMVIKILQSTLDVLQKIDFYKISDSLGKVAHYTGDIFGFLSKNISLIANTLLGIALILGARKVGGAIGGIIASGRMKKGAIMGAYSSWKNNPGLFPASKFMSRGIFRNALLSAGLPKILASGFLIATRVGFFKTLLLFATKAIGFLGGPWGILLQILIGFIPKIASWIGQKLQEKKDTLNAWAEIAKRNGWKSADDIKNVNADLNNIFRTKGYTGLEKYAKDKYGLNETNLTYTDKGTVEINVYGDTDPQKIAKLQSQNKKNVKEQITSMLNNFKNKPQSNQSTQYSAYKNI